MAQHFLSDGHRPWVKTKSSPSRVKKVVVKTLFALLAGAYVGVVIYALFFGPS